MGAQESSERLIDEPEEIAEFRKSDNPTAIIPELPMKRKVTDQKYIFIFGIFIAFFVPFLIYALAHSNFNEMFRASYNSEISFEEQDERPPFVEIANDLHKSAGKIVSICIFGLCVSVGMLLLFRYFTAVIVWTILIGSMLGIFALTFFFWILSGRDDESGDLDLYENNYSRKREYIETFRYLAYFFTFVSLIFFVIVICMIKRIKLVIRLFRESIRVIFGIPLILLEPLLTFLALTILYLMYFVVMLYIQTPTTEFFAFNGLAKFSFIYHVLIVLWMHRFIIGCQHMVISGAISTYYFTRDKASISLTGPIYTSFCNLFRFHLGTVALGSLLITIVEIIKAFIRRFLDNRLIRCIVGDCCLTRFQTFLKFISKNAYIQTAMHGQPFFRSARRAVQLLAANTLSVIAINSVGDFVLGMAKLKICLITFGFALLIDDNSVKNYWAVILIGVIVTAIIAHSFFTVFETAVDTLFLCFCEDMCMNDGTQQQYYMSVNLMQYVNDAKKANKS